MKITVSANLKHMNKAHRAGDDYSKKLQRYIPVALEDLAKRGQTWVEKYPPPPEPRPNVARWVRGLGLIYYKKDGSMSIYTPSEKMNTKWQIHKISKHKFALTNSASYSGFVQVADLQNPVHQATGWFTDRMMLRYLSSTINAIIPDLMTKIRSM